MPKLTLPIAIGKQYIRRDGEIITTVPHLDRRFACTNGRYGSTAVWCRSGLVFEFAGQTHEHDLVADATEAKGHKHAALMALYAQDAAETDKPWERWEFRREAGDWVTGFAGEHPAWSPNVEYRRKPKTIRIGEFDVPEPLRGAPTEHSRIFVVTVAGDDPCYSDTWAGTLHDRSLLSRGLIHLDVEAAELHAKALLSFTSREA